MDGTAASAPRTTWLSVRRRYLIRSATVRIRSWCCFAKACRSGMRAMVPSSFMISQITPAGFRPASRARSTLPSVWPVRRRTPPGLRDQREYVAGPRQIRGASVARHRGPNGARAVGRGDAGGDALARLDRDRERGAVGRLVLRVAHHHRQVELPGALRRDRQADQPARVAGHEVHRLGGAELGGDADVALVLAVLVVGEDDHLAGLEVLDRRAHARHRIARLQALVGAHLAPLCYLQTR